MEAYFRVGQVAEMLRTSEHHIRRLCVAGLIEAEQSPGGHWRIPASEVDRLRKTRLPPIPQGLAEERPTSEASCEPEEDPEEPDSAYENLNERIRESRADVSVTENLVRRRKAELELELAEQRLQEAREQRRKHDLARQGERERDLATRRAEAARPGWTGRWLARAQGKIPYDAPPEVRTIVYKHVQEKLQELTPSQPYELVSSLVGAWVEEKLEPWRRKRAAQELLQAACRQLPLGAKGWFAEGYSSPPNRWETMVIQRAAAALHQMSPDFTWPEVQAAAFAAAEEVAEEFKRTLLPASAESSPGISSTPIVFPG